MRDFQDILTQCSLFERCPDALLSECVALCTVHTFQVGDALCVQGAHEKTLYILISGAIRTFIRLPNGEEVTLRILSRVGSFVGEHCWWGDELSARTRSASMHEVGEVLVVPDEVATLFKRQLPELAERIRQLRFNQKQRRSLLESSQFCTRLFTLGEGAQVRRYQAGETIFEKGDPSHSALLIQSGSVNVHSPSIADQQHVTERLFQGQLFGERSLLRGEARIATVTAHEDVELLEISATRLKTFTDGLPHITQQLDSLRRFERLDNGVIVVQYDGELNGQVAIITVSHLGEGISVIGTLLVSIHQYQAQLYDVHHESRHEELIACPAPEGKRRDLWLDQQRITRIETLGTWSELSALQALMLAQEPLSHERIERLLSSQIHRFHDTPLPALPSSGVMCTCMQLSRAELMSAFNQGARSVAQLMEQTGVGTCCGGCIPAISELCQESIGQPATITKYTQRSPDTYTLKLTPESEAHLTPAQAGQHIIVSLAYKGGWLSRPYTLTSPLTEQRYREVTIKRLRGGYLSQLLLSSDVGTQVRISEPRGTFTINLQRSPHVVFFAAGIGVTPALSFAFALSEADDGARLLIHHSARTEGALTFQDTLQALSVACPQLTYMSRVTSQAGRLTRKEVKAIYKANPEAHFYLCGPPAYLQWLESTLLSVKVSPDRLHIERFSFMTTHEAPSSPLIQRRTLVLTLGWSSGLGYLAQDLLDLSPTTFRAWQSASSVRLWTGLTGLLFLGLLWSLAFFHRTRADQRYPWLERHRALGALAPFFLFFHASRAGYAALFALSITYLLVTLSGLLEPSGFSGAARALWLGVHISLSIGFISLLAVHLYAVVAFQ